MTTLNQTSHVANRPTFSSSMQPKQSGIASLRSSIKRCLLAAGLAAAVAAPAWSAQQPDLAAPQNAAPTADPETAARAEWKAVMKQNSPQAEGCFHASYPSIVVERVECNRGAPSAHPRHINRTGDETEVVGNGHDYVAYSQSLITQANGSVHAKGVKSEKSVGVADYGGGGILGSDEYTVQLNTNLSETTSACDGHSGCTVWQQFVYATDYIGPGTAAVFMQYWLINYGYSACPSGWLSDAPDCYKNSLLAPAPDLSIKDLNDMELTATATAGGSDEIEFYYGSEYWWVREPDSVVDISSVWNEVEFNVLGDAGGSKAAFNNGSNLGVSILLQDESSAAPLCLDNAGTTGETNNLKLGKCSALALGPGYGYVHFTESN